MEYFLQLFGDKTIGWLVAIIAMIIFLAACYKKVEEYFSTKAIREKEKKLKGEYVIDTNSIILKSSGGKRFKVTASDAGTLTATEI